MSMEDAAQASSARIIVVGNEKGGSGKSTVAMHITIALMRLHHRVATIDLDSRQKTFTHYIENRHAWSQRIARDLGIPNHLYFVENTDHPSVEEEISDGSALTDQVNALKQSSNFVVIDTPGRDCYLGRLAHSMADILITPLNDSFVDLDVLGTVNRETFEVIGASHYAQMVEGARLQHNLRGNIGTDWIVLRNRLSTLGSRNTRCVGDCLRELGRRLNFRSAQGLAERVIFREFYLRGLTALDSLDESTLGTRPTMSHLAARLEIENLLGTLGLHHSGTSGEMNSNRSAA